MQRTQEQAYEECVASGAFIPLKTVEHSRVRSMVALADEDLAVIAGLQEHWNTRFKLSYDVLHTLAEALLLLDKVKSANHQCLFAYLCVKHPELDFDWGFLERLRTKRNGIHYDGDGITKNEYKALELQLMLYVKTLRETVRAKTR